MSQISSVVTGASLGAVMTLTGNTGGAVGPTGGNINVEGTGSISVAGNPGTSTLTISNSGAVTTSFVTDSGTATPVAGVINFKEAAEAQGSTRFVASGNTVSVTYTDANFNTGIGLNTLLEITSGIENACVGSDAGSNITSGGNNSLFGGNSGLELVTGSRNSGVGYVALGSLLSGTDNCGLGSGAGSGYTSSESNNISIGSGVLGTAAESYTLRIGTATGSSSQGNLKAAYICGIDGVNVGSVATVVTEASNKLGTAVLTAGSGVSITPTANVITIASTGGGLAYVDQTSSSATFAINTSYGIDNGASLVTLTLPAAAVIGSVFQVVGFSSGGWKIAQLAGQTINFGNVATTVGVTGFISSTNQYDCITFRCVVANTTFVAYGAQGNPTIF